METQTDPVEMMATIESSNTDVKAQGNRTQDDIACLRHKNIDTRIIDAARKRHPKSENSKPMPHCWPTSLAGSGLDSTQPIGRGRPRTTLELGLSNPRWYQSRRWAKRFYKPPSLRQKDKPLCWGHSTSSSTSHPTESRQVCLLLST